LVYVLVLCCCGCVSKVELLAVDMVRKNIL
jgi:hypothetical protein